MPDAMHARDGDVLVVSYPEVKVPVAKYAIVGVGGLVYTRQLQSGDDVGKQYAQIYEFLKRTAESTAAEKVETWSREINPSAPKPAPPGVRAPAPAGVRAGAPVPPLPRGGR